MGVGRPAHSAVIPLSVDKREEERLINELAAKKERTVNGEKKEVSSYSSSTLSEIQQNLLTDIIKGNPTLHAGQIAELFEMRTNRPVHTVTVRKYRNKITRAELQANLKKEIEENGERIEAEFKAIEEIDRSLIILSRSSAERVLRYIGDRYGLLVDRY